MKTFPDLVVCEHCDSVYRRLALESGEVAHCGRCAAELYRTSRLDVDRWLALTVAAFIVFVIANVRPVISINLQGLHNEATIWQAVAVLAHGAAAPIALSTAFSVIVVPFLQIALLGWVLAYARIGRRAPGFTQVMRALRALRPWSMVEFCVLGLLIAVIKLSSIVQVALGPGIWATAILMVLITLIAKRDLNWLWELTASPMADEVRS